MSTERAGEYLNKTREAIRGVITPRWGINAVVGSLVALGVMMPDTAIAQPVLDIYGIGKCSPHGDSWNPNRHRDVGFRFGERGTILSEGRAVTITDVSAKRMVVTHYEPAGKIADTWTTLTHGGAASIDAEQEPIIFQDGQTYFTEVFLTDDPKTISMGGNSIAVVAFAGCPQE